MSEEIEVGQRWSRYDRNMQRGTNTIEVMCINEVTNELCVRYIRHEGNLEVLGIETFKDQFYLFVGGIRKVRCNSCNVIIDRIDAIKKSYGCYLCGAEPCQKVHDGEDAE